MFFFFPFFPFFFLCFLSFRASLSFLPFSSYFCPSYFSPSPSSPSYLVLFLLFSSFSFIIFFCFFFSFFFFFFLFFLLLLLVPLLLLIQVPLLLLLLLLLFGSPPLEKNRKGTEDPKTFPEKGQKNLFPPVFGANMSHVTISPPRLQCKNYATRVPPRVSRSSENELQSKTHVPPEKRGEKERKKMGTKSWVLNRTAKRGSQNWVDFFKKNNAFRTTFSHVSCNWGQNLGFFLAPGSIYIYIYIPYVSGSLPLYLPLCVCLLSLSLYISLCLFLFLSCSVSLILPLSL